MRGSRSEICQCVLAETGHGKPIDGAQESAVLGSWPRRFPYDSAETCVIPNFVLSFNPAQQKVRRDGNRHNRWRTAAVIIDVSILEYH